MWEEPGYELDRAEVRETQRELAAESIERPYGLDGAAYDDLIVEALTQEQDNETLRRVAGLIVAGLRDATGDETEIGRLISACVIKYAMQCVADRAEQQVADAMAARADDYRSGVAA